MTLNQIADEFCLFTANLLIVVALSIILFKFLLFLYHFIKYHLRYTKRKRQNKRNAKYKRLAEKTICGKVVRWN